MTPTRWIFETLMVAAVVVIGTYVTSLYVLSSTFSPLGVKHHDANLALIATPSLLGICWLLLRIKGIPRTRRKDICQHCSYDLTATEFRCPECGLLTITAKGLENLKRAAEDGNPKAAYVLGLAFSCGGLVDKDLNKAKQFLHLSAKCGYAPASALLNHLRECERLRD